MFFTEPYRSAGWRIGEVYRDLLPRLRALAWECGLKLVFKLHPFESIEGHQNLLRKLLPRDQFSEIQWIAGPASSELWNNTRLAMTVKSTIALECVALGIPVFLCTWSQSAYGGYPQQYAKFGLGIYWVHPTSSEMFPSYWQAGQSLARRTAPGFGEPLSRENYAAC